jgi:hypothetical protein
VDSFLPLMRGGIFKAMAQRVVGIAAIALLLVLAGIDARSSTDFGEKSLFGKLRLDGGKPVLLEPGGRETRLTSDDEATSETLADASQSGKDLKVIGRSRPDGSFDVQEFYIVRGNSLYRLIYFCDVCHITTFNPGDCLCCQKPMVPTEVPLTDPRVHHEEIKPLSPR